MTTGLKIGISIRLTIIMVAIAGLCNGQGNNMAGAGKTLKAEPPPDKALLAQFELLSKKLSNIKGNYTLAGLININDHANPAGNMSNVDFLFCKKGDDFYYKLGTTATINEEGVYLYIDYKIKTIMLSAKKQVVYDNGLKAIGDLGANIKSENYRLTSKVTGDEQTLTLINEYHISCKQYSITFNRRDMGIKQLYLRLSNPNNPGGTGNEKIIDVKILKWNNTADITQYLTKNEIVKNVNGGWKTVNEFKNYRLIKM